MNVWAQVLAALGRKLNRQCLDTWFKPISFQGCDAGTLRLSVPNENFRKWLLENYAGILDEAVREVLRAPFAVNITVETTAHQEAVPRMPEPTEQAGCPGLNPKCTFDTFVVGSSNQFARAAAHAVAEQPSKAYNPLYIYGGVGLGKTHLMHAVGHYIRQKNPRLRLSYMSAERFMNELINCIRYDRTLQFREKYRSIDVLLIDDIQFIAGKERTQEEFFHTFNALYDAQRQIVITSDCPPKAIPTIEERLHSRFEWGLIADIQPPDLETKVAIVKKKAEAEFGTVSDAVALFIGGCVRSNIRELEGALTRLGARASLEGIDASAIDVDYAREVLKDLISDDRTTVSADMVIRAVSSYYGLRPAQLKAKNNSRPIVVPRQVAMFVCKELTSLSLPQIGKGFGGKHHTTVLHSIRKIDKQRKKDSAISEAIDKITKSFR